jgi:MoaA/NifB/PqqE/SkfB family radical SAM enzyme
MENRHLPERFGIKEGAEQFPLMVVLSMSYVCNARCPQCPYTQSDIRETYEDALFMSQELFKKIADECGQYGSYLRLSGGGEPLLHPQMLELIEYAKNAGARVGLITNGSLLTPERVDRLLKAGTDMIEVSVDAADPETYGKIRIGLNFDRLVRHLRYAVKTRNEWDSPTSIVVSVVNQQLIEGKIDQIVDFWKAIADNVIVRKYLTWGIGDESWSADPTPYIPDHRVPCPFPFERLNVDSRGDIMFCGYDIAGETCSIFGNVMEKSIREIWQGAQFTKWRDLLLAGEYEKIEICSKCPDWRYRSWKYNYWNVVEHAEKTRRERTKVLSRYDKEISVDLGDD